MDLIVITLGDCYLWTLSFITLILKVILGLVLILVGMLNDCRWWKLIGVWGDLLLKSEIFTQLINLLSIEIIIFGSHFNLSYHLFITWLYSVITFSDMLGVDFFITLWKLFQVIFIQLNFFQHLRVKFLTLLNFFLQFWMKWFILFKNLSIT